MGIKNVFLKVLAEIEFLLFERKRSCRLKATWLEKKYIHFTSVADESEMSHKKYFCILVRSKTFLEYLVLERNVSNEIVCLNFLETPWINFSLFLTDAAPYMAFARSALKIRCRPYCISKPFPRDTSHIDLYCVTHICATKVRTDSPVYCSNQGDRGKNACRATGLPPQPVATWSAGDMARGGIRMYTEHLPSVRKKHYQQL